VKVLQITPSFHPAYVYGGATRAVYDLCSNLAEGGCNVRVLTTDANGPHDVLKVDTKTDVILADRLSARYCHRIMDVAVSPAFIEALPAAMKDCDVVHLNAVYSFTTIPALIAARTFSRPIVWTPHGMFQRWLASKKNTVKSLWDWVCRVMSPRALVLHFTSEDERSESLGRFPGFESVVIPNSVELPTAMERSQRNGCLRLLYLGRLDPKKGIENLIQACGLLGRGASFVNWKLTIAGGGEDLYTRSLRDLVASEGLENRVTMAGQIEGECKRQAFVNADLVIVPSHTENFGLVVGESLAYGVPVIASKGTPWRKVEEVGCGLWVENSPAALADAVERASAMRLDEMGEKGRDWITREFSGRSIARRMSELYARVIRGKEPAGIKRARIDRPA